MTRIALKLATGFSTTLATILLLAALLLFSFLRGQDVNYDQLNYHYYTSYAFLHWRYATDIAPAQSVHTYLNPLIYIPWYAATTLIGPRVATVLQCVLAAFVMLPLYALSRAMLGLKGRNADLFAALAVVLALLSPTFWSEAGTSFSDSTLATPVLAALYLALAGLTSGRKNLFLYSGLLIGAASGLKLTNCVYAVALELLLFTYALKNRAYFKFLAIHALAAFCGLCLSSGWLFALCWHKFSNPLFPYFNSVFHSPYARPVANMDTRYVPHSLRQAAGYVLQWARGGAPTSELIFRDIRPLLGFAIIPLAMIASVYWRRTRGKNENAFVFLNGMTGFLILSCILWMSLFSIQRYWIVGELLIGLTIAGWLWRTLPRPAATILLAACCLASLGTIKISDWRHIPWQSPTFRTVIPDQFHNTDVIFLAGEPISYIVPSFSRSTRSVGFVDWDLPDPSHPTPFTQSILDAIAHGSSAVVINGNLSSPARATLAFYGLTISQNCGKIGGFYPDSAPLSICSLEPAAHH